MESLKKSTITFLQSLAKLYKAFFFNLPYETQIAILALQNHSAALTSYTPLR